MRERPAAVIVPVAIIFFASGLIVNLIQATCYVIVRPVSKNLHRRINRVVAELLWLELVWLIDWWAGVKCNEAAQFRKMMAERNSRMDVSCSWIIVKDKVQ